MSFMDRKKATRFDRAASFIFHGQNAFIFWRDGQDRWQE